MHPTPPDDASNTHDGGLHAARELFVKGWHPLPLPKNAKTPPPEGSTGTQGIDLSESEINASAWDGNIATRMPGDVIGLDIDAYHGGDDTLAAMIAELGHLPPTWISHSNRRDGSGIRFYRVPAGFTWIASLAGIDIIQRWHRYAIVAPSMHPDGRRYEWWDQTIGGPAEIVPAVEDLPELPWEWVEYLTRDASGGTQQTAIAVNGAGVQQFFDEHTAADAQSYASVIVDHFTEKVKGGHSRHDSMQHCLTWAMEHARAGVLNAELTVDKLSAAWVDALVGEPRRQQLTHPTRTTEFQAMLRHAIGKANAKTDDQLHKMHDDVAGITMEVTRDLAKMDIYQAPEDAPDDFLELVEVVDLGPFIDGTAIKITPDLGVMTNGEALLHLDRLNGVHGETGGGKSFLVCFCIRELIRAQKSVMLIDLEDTPGPLIERLRQIGCTDADIKAHVVFLSPEVALGHARVVEQLIEIARARGVVHVFVETVGEAFSLEGINENNDAEVAPWLRAFCRHFIAETGIGITLSDHGTKAAEHPLDPSGSKRKRAAITGTAWLMQSVTPFDRKDGGLSVLTCAKDRHGWYKRGEQIARLVMDQLDPITGQTALSLHRSMNLAGMASAELTDVVRALRAAHPMPLSQHQLCAEVRNAGGNHSNDAIRKAADESVAKGLARESVGPRNARMFVSTSPTNIPTP